MIVLIAAIGPLVSLQRQKMQPAIQLRRSGPLITNPRQRVRTNVERLPTRDVYRRRKDVGVTRGTKSNETERSRVGRGEANR